MIESAKPPKGFEDDAPSCPGTAHPAPPITKSRNAILPAPINPHKGIQITFQITTPTQFFTVLKFHKLYCLLVSNSNVALTTRLKRAPPNLFRTEIQNHDRNCPRTPIKKQRPYLTVPNHTKFDSTSCTAT